MVDDVARPFCKWAHHREEYLSPVTDPGVLQGIRSRSSSHTMSFSKFDMASFAESEEKEEINPKMESGTFVCPIEDKEIYYQVSNTDLNFAELGATLALKAKHRTVWDFSSGRLRGRGRQHPRHIPISPSFFYSPHRVLRPAHAQQDQDKQLGEPVGVHCARRPRHCH